jgi:oxygen-independent coproporphyrinogen-3 oxidase
VDLYIRSLDIELDRLPSEFSPDTVFIGGGTPTALEPHDYQALLDAIHKRINLDRVVEFSSEANPGTLTPAKLKVMKEGGINRVSIGVQSFNDKALRLLGRIHKGDQAKSAYHMLREAGFDNVNIDLIQSIPGMTPEDILEDARTVAELGPDHISYYNLIYEPGTPMTKDRDEGRIAPPGDDEEADNYFAVKHALEAAGYGHYEISNFCRPDRECLHNVLYWQGGEYFGCGPSAHSHWSGKRFGNIRDLQGYCERLEGNVRPFDEIEQLDPADKARETLVMWLRMLDGVDLERFAELTGYQADDLCGESIDHFIEEGLLVRGKNQLQLSRNALFVCNSVFSELV